MCEPVSKENIIILMGKDFKKDNIKKKGYQHNIIQQAFQEKSNGTRISSRKSR